jgi:polysaccharide biosynthesis protein PslH
MKILFVTSEIPYPPDNGVRIVSHHAMRLMRERGHELALAVLSDERDRPFERFETAAAQCARGNAFLVQLPRRSRAAVLLAATLRQRLYFMERYHNGEFQRRLRALIDSFQPDVVHFDIILMTQYRSMVPDGIGTIASINDSYTLMLENALSAHAYSSAESVYRRYQMFQSRRYERTAYREFDWVHVVSPVDEQYLKRLNPQLRVAVIPNGVDDSLFSGFVPQRKNREIAFVGKLARDNVFHLRMFLGHAWPLIQERVPGVIFNIAGKLEAEAGALKEEWASRPAVRFLGYAERLADAYGTAGIAVIPVNKTGGFVNKTVEAMAAGVVPVGFASAFNGIAGAIDGVHFISAAGFEQMGERVSDLLIDSERRGRMATAARELAMKGYAWSSRAGAFEDMYTTAAQRGIARARGPDGHRN